MNAAASPAVLLAAARCSQRGLRRQGHGRRDSTPADKRLPQLPRYRDSRRLHRPLVRGAVADVGCRRGSINTEVTAQPGSRTACPIGWTFAFCSPSLPRGACSAGRVAQRSTAAYRRCQRAGSCAGVPAGRHWRRTEPVCPDSRLASRFHAGGDLGLVWGADTRGRMHGSACPGRETGLADGPESGCEERHPIGE